MFYISCHNCIQISITSLTTRLLRLKENVNDLYKYMTVLASYIVNPFIVPLDEFRGILVYVKQDIRAYLKLELPEDLDQISELTVMQ